MQRILDRAVPPKLLLDVRVAEHALLGGQAAVRAQDAPVQRQRRDQGRGGGAALGGARGEGGGEADGGSHGFGGSRLGS